MASRSELPYAVTPRDGRSLEEEIAFQWEALAEQRIADRRALVDQRHRDRATYAALMLESEDADRDKWIENARRLPMREIRRRLLARELRHSARNTS